MSESSVTEVSVPKSSVSESSGQSPGCQNIMLESINVPDYSLADSRVS